MNTRRKIVTVLGAGIVVAPFRALAQQPAKVYRLAFLGASSAAGITTLTEALRAGLHEQGYFEGKNITIESRWADGKYERLPALAAELVALKPDIIVAQATSGALAAKQATSTIPIIMPSVTDPVANGLVTSLARPGGNVTGMTYFAPELAAKQIELLKETLPHSKKLAALLNPDSPASATQFRAMTATAAALKIGLAPFEARAPDDFPKAISAMRANRFDGLVVMDDPVLYSNTSQIAELVMKHRLPSSGFRELAEAGGLMAYGVNRHEMWRRVGIFVDKILKGAKAGELPIERATRFDMLVNLKTAKALGIKVPQTIMIQATKVIE